MCVVITQMCGHYVLGFAPTLRVFWSQNILRRPYNCKILLTRQTEVLCIKTHAKTLQTYVTDPVVRVRVWWITETISQHALNT